MQRHPCDGNRRPNGCVPVIRYVAAPAAAQVTVDVNNTPLESTAVIVTTTPTLSVGKVKVMLEGEVAIVAVAGVTPTTDDERT